MAKKPNPRTPEKERRNEAAFAKPGTGQFTPGSSKQPNPAKTGQPAQSASQPITNQGATAFTQTGGKVTGIQQPNVPQAPIVAPPSPAFMEKVAKAAHMENVVSAPVQAGQMTGTVQTQQGAPGAQEQPLNMTATPAEQPGRSAGKIASRALFGFDKTVDGQTFRFPGLLNVGTTFSAAVETGLPSAGTAVGNSGFTVKAANLVKTLIGNKVMTKSVTTEAGVKTVTQVVNTNKLAAWALKTFIALSAAQFGNVAFGMFQKNEASDSANMARSDAKFGAVALAMQAEDYAQYQEANELAQMVVDTEIEVWNPIAALKGNALNAEAKKRALQISKQVVIDQKTASEKGETKEQQETRVWEQRKADAEAVRKANDEAFLATTKERLRLEEASAARKNEAFVQSSLLSREGTKNFHPTPAQQRLMEKKNAEDLKALDQYYQDYDEIVAMMREETRPSNVLK